MQPAARLQTSIELWDIIWNARVPMDNVCGDYFRGRRYIGSKDRAEIAERVYSAMRHYARTTWWINKLNLDDTGRSRIFIHTLCVENKSFQRLTDLCSGSKYCPQSLADDEMATLKQLENQNITHKDMPLAAQVECPDWAHEKLQTAYQDDFETALQAMMAGACLDIRMNTIKVQNRDDVLMDLKKANIETKPTPYSPIGLRATGKIYLAASKSFKKGHVEIQDEGSQLLALICHAKPGMQVLDYCAGGGGKTLALAASMQNKGRIVAMDIDPRRLNKAKPRLTKAGIHNVELRAIEDEKHKKWFKRQKETFDIVLVDAPCGSSGTWRRNPDLRWKQYGPDLETIQTLQSDILNKVTKTVKPDGRLIYATCSVFQEENENQITRFLSDHPEFRLIPAAQAWKEADLPHPCPVEGDYLRLSPHKHNTDGFFAAVLEKTGQQ